MISNIIMLDRVEDSLAPLARAFRQVLGNGCLVHTVGEADEAEASLRSVMPYHMAVVGVQPGDEAEGFPVLRRLRGIGAGLPLIAVADQGSVQTAARAVAAGATDLLVCGEQLEDRVTTLLGKVRQLVRLYVSTQELQDQATRLRAAEQARHRMVGDSPQLRGLINQARRVATVPRPVLVIGERGTGKELVARAIHEAAAGPERPMVSVNCAAFSDSLLESELFGHERGAYTGADREVPGKFELADGGTLFLDEIGCMSLPFQQKILRTVEYGVFVRVGGSRELQTNARIVAATNADLEQKMAAGELLRDLYDRLAFEVIQVPPLRQREGDVVLLANHFLAEFMREVPAIGSKRLGPSAITALERYPFPGNIRELKTVIERAAYRDDSSEIVAEDLGLPVTTVAPATTGSFEQRVEAYKRHLVLDALTTAAGNQAEAARSLGMSYHQYRYFLRKYR